MRERVRYRNLEIMGDIGRVCEIQVWERYREI